MNEKDDIILEYLDRIHPVAEPPRVIHFNLDRCDEELEYSKRTDGGFSYDTLRNRVRRLEDVGVVEVVREKNRYLGIAEEGSRYLAGELDVSELDSQD